MKFKTHLFNLANAHSTHPSHLHAAVVAKGKRILGQGVNRGFHHAEANALREGVDFKNATLYTLMVRRRSGTLGNGSPCAECMRLIKKAKLKKVVVYV